MAKYTANLKLEIPEYTDNADIPALMEKNNTILDEKVTEIRENYVVDTLEEVSSAKAPSVNAVNTEFSKLSNNYIVESGTKDNWNYRIWSDNTLECWISVLIGGVSVSTAWGSIYVADDKISSLDFPFEFEETPVFQMTSYKSNGNFWTYLGNISLTSTHSPSFGVARGASGTITNLGANLYAIGKLKEE